MSAGTVLANEASSNQPPTRIDPDDDTHSSPAVHSGRLTYAKPRDLPSFPSVGVRPNGSAAGAAATLGWHNKKSPEIWKPDSSPSASTAALLAKDHKMASTWAPSPSAHGAQAALLAHKNARNSDGWKPSATDHGHSAAYQAFKANRNSAVTNNTATTLNRQRSLIAAKGAMGTRPRANTAPASKDSYPDEANAAANALRAATAAHNPKRSTAQTKGGAVPVTTMNRQMFTSSPPVKPEVEEQSREEQLHATAVAMAKKMFSQQQKLIDEAKKSKAENPAAPRRTRSSSTLSDDAEVRPMQFNTLQDAAYKLAQERLAKLHEENLKNRDFQEYYYGHARPQRKFTIMGKLQRRRSSSDGDIIEDQRRSQQIRKQMSIFSSKLSEVDGKKRQQDRDAVLAAAQRNVQARLRGMDEKISAETGMIPPSSLIDWEAKAHAAAQSRSDKRMSKHGKVDIGAGKYMDQEENDAIAAQKVQPTIDEINEKAEKEHIRQTELRLKAEAEKEAKEKEKAREKEIADIAKKLKEQDKQETKERKAEEKKEAKAKRDEEKAAKAEQRRLSGADRHRLAPIPFAHRQNRQEEPPEEQHEGQSTTVEPPTDERVALNDVGQPVRVPAPAAPVITEEELQPSRVEIPNKEQPVSSDDPSPTDKVSPTGKVKTWFKSHFSRGSKSEDDKSRDGAKRGFIGGHALTGMENTNDSTTSVDNRSSSVRAVAMAGQQRPESSNADTPNVEDVSPMSSSSDDDYYNEARDQMGHGLTPPRPIRDPAEKKSRSPVRDSRFHEII